MPIEVWVQAVRAKLSIVELPVRLIYLGGRAVVRRIAGQRDHPARLLPCGAGAALAAAPASWRAAQRIERDRWPLSRRRFVGCKRDDSARCGRPQTGRRTIDRRIPFSRPCVNPCSGETDGRFPAILECSGDFARHRDAVRRRPGERANRPADDFETMHCLRYDCEKLHFGRRGRMVLMGQSLEYRRLRTPRMDGGTLVEPPLSTVDDMLAAQRRWPGRSQLRFRRPAAHRSGPAGAVRNCSARPWPIPPISRHARHGGRSDAPVVLAGHQPQLFHPGVWFKNFVLSSLAEAQAATRSTW